MLKSYDPADWYWVADDGRVYASARSEIVAKDDATFQAWVESGGLATRWPTDDAGAQTDTALADVLAPYGIAVSMAARRQDAFEAAMAYGNAITAKVTGAYSDVEARTWPLQRTQADQVLAGGTLLPDALLLKLAARRSMAAEAFALVVQVKAQAFETIADVGQGLRLGAEGLLDASLDTPEKLAAAVEALRAQTVKAAAQLGLTI